MCKIAAVEISAVGVGIFMVLNLPVGSYRKTC